jgi:hypothetical protein
MNVELKIKAASLAAESKIIRQEEQRIKKDYMRARDLSDTKTALARRVRSLERILDSKYTGEFGTPTKLNGLPLTALVEGQVSIDFENLKPLQFTEAQIERFKKKAADAQRRVSTLQSHRTKEVRMAARETHLARMFLKSTPISCVETIRRYGKQGPNIERIIRMVLKYKRDTQYENCSEQDIRQYFAEWLDQSKYEYHKDGTVFGSPLKED